MAWYRKAPMALRDMTAVQGEQYSRVSRTWSASSFRAGCSLSGGKRSVHSRYSRNAALASKPGCASRTRSISRHCQLDRKSLSWLRNACG